MFELVRHDERIRIVSDGVALVDVFARDGDRIEGRLTEASGARCEIVLPGALADREFRLSGRGPLVVGPLTIADATVRVEPSGITVSWTAPWPDGPAIGSVEMSDGVATWRGRLDARQTLQCLMTKSEVLRTSITFDIDPRATQPSAAALAVLDGRNIEVPLGQSWWTALDSGGAAIRAATLDAVARYLRQELETSEADFVKANFDDGETDARRWRDLDDIAIAAGNGPTKSTSVVAAGSYLPAASARSARALVSSTGPGYIPATGARAPTGGAYVAAAPRPHSNDRGVGAGYLPSTPRSAGYLPTGTTDDRRQRATRSDVAADAAPPAGGSAHAYLDVERVGYAVLRCKDLLQAVDAARAKEIAGHAR